MEKNKRDYYYLKIIDKLNIYINYNEYLKVKRIYSK